MKKKTCYFPLVLMVFLALWGCGGGGSGGDSSGSGGSGTVTMSVTDAKPTLPLGNVEKVSITFDEVSVHKSGEGWISLDLAQEPYTIDLLQFQSGATTQLVPPASLTSGKYTQVRIGVKEAFITINENDRLVEVPIDIPSENLKTDKNFEFDVTGGGAVDLTVDFDLSQSIVVTGQQNYKLKPVLHLNQTQEAATIQGKINNSSFEKYQQATIIVTWDKDGDGVIDGDDEEYTRLTVEQESSSTDTDFRIFWLVPGEAYVVQVVVNGSEIHSEAVPSLPAGAVFDLNKGNAI